ncbi:MAG: alanine racemase [Marinosulfonomonas sp.]|nr:MAG: alanine racemase [Marinosulfonomonas sp.]
MNFPEIDTPSVLVDLDKTEANIKKFQDYCDEHQLPVRPHIKTHKMPRIAKLQIAAGAIGITCQKISEAEAMIAEGGIDDVLITYNILGDKKVKRLRALADKVKLSVVADNIEVIEGLSKGFADAPVPLPVLIECNTGADRCGVDTPAQAADLAVAIDAAPGLHFSGLMTYPAIGENKKVEAWLSSAISLIKERGLNVEVVSSGGSPTMWQAHEMPLATEFRIGTYVYNDGFLVKCGVCGWDDCALTVLATVVSVPSEKRAVIDAGSKVLTSDLLGLEGHGHILGRPDLQIDQLSEEHGRIVTNGQINLKVGDRVRIVPNHCCVVTNMLDHVVLVRANEVEGKADVVARGLVW